MIAMPEQFRRRMSMKYRHTHTIALGLLSGLLILMQGCSGMKWFNHGGDEQSSNLSSQERAGAGSADSAGSRSDRHASTDSGTPDGFPSLSLQTGPEAGSFDSEGGRLSGLSSVEGDRISGEERLSRSRIGTMLRPVDQGESMYAELKRQEDAAIMAGLQDVFYAYNRWLVQDEGIQALSRNAGWLKDNPTAQLRISGHCDERGSHDYNLVLGEKRAHAAKDVLVELGVNPKQVTIVSYGKDRPFCRESDETCYQENRRGHMLLRTK
jgi:peptidoglycan-associated lipoprotein